MTMTTMAANGEIPVLDISSISLIHVNVGKRQLRNTGKLLHRARTQQMLYNNNFKFENNIVNCQLTLFPLGF
jgi:hypothetical protein